VSSIDKVATGYRARWRTPEGGTRGRTFTRKVDAQAHLTKIEAAKLGGRYVDTSAERLTFGQYAQVWMERQHWRDSTAALVESNLRRHVLPVLGSRRLSTITRLDVEAWARGVRVAPSTLATIRQHLGSVFAAAVDEGVIARNPVTKALMPKPDQPPARALTREQIDALIAASDGPLVPAIALGLGAGLRQGEACGLQRGHIDFLRRQLEVAGQLVTPAKGAPFLGPPKTQASYRTVPLADEVLEVLAEYLRIAGPGEHGLILHVEGRPIGRNRWGDLWRATAKRAGLPGVRFHDLRHTFASTLLSNGVSIAAVSGWLGHASPSVTLSTYAHMMPVDEDRARRVIATALGAVVSPACHEGTKG
jgi:integrase